MKKPMAGMMKKVESSAEDRARDKKMGTKEGSPADRKMDMAQAKRMSARKPAVAPPRKMTPAGPTVPATPVNSIMAGLPPMGKKQKMPGKKPY